MNSHTVDIQIMATEPSNVVEKISTQTNRYTPILPRILGPEWSRIRWQRHDGVIMFFACDVKNLLGLSNVTTATKGVTSGNRVAWGQRVKAVAYDPRIPAKVILLTLAGVFQLILNNSSPMCKKYRDFIACRYLPERKGLVLYQKEAA